MYKAKEWFACDVMIFDVYFAAPEHPHVGFYEKITPHNSDASLNLLELMYGALKAKATPCIFKLATNELLLLSLMSFDEKLLSSSSF